MEYLSSSFYLSSKLFSVYYYIILIQLIFYFAGFIDFIVDPSLAVCSDMLEYILAPIMGNQTGKAKKDCAQGGFYIIFIYY